MICASRLVHSFYSIARYLETPKPHREDQVRVAWMEGRNIISDKKLMDAACEMELVAAASTLARRPGLHFSISWSPEDDPSRDQMTEVSDRVLKKLNLQDHQAILVAHGDEDYDHVHAIANRIHPITHRPLDLGLFYRQVQETLRRAEREMNFVETPGHLYQMPGQSPPDRRESLSKRAHKATQARGEIPFQLLVRDVAETDFDHARSWEDLHSRLDKQGLQLVPRRRGLVVTDGHEYAKCSSVAKDVSLRKLEERFGESWRSAKEIKLDRQIEGLKRGAIEKMTSSKKRQTVKEFLRLDGLKIGLKARLGKEIYQSLQALANDTQQRGDLGL